MNAGAHLPARKKGITMKRHHSRLYGANPLLPWTELAMKTGEMMLASAQVISHRTTRMAQAGPMPNERDRREFTLMGQEKLDAAAASAQAMALRMVSANQQFAATAFQQMMSSAGGWMALLATPVAALSGQKQAELLRDTMMDSAAAASQMADSIAHVAHHGLKPIHSRAVSNAKRLGKL
jgi:hypothetical protein